MNLLHKKLVRLLLTEGSLLRFFYAFLHSHIDENHEFLGAVNQNHI